jgi:hypothetical protein
MHRDDHVYRSGGVVDRYIIAIKKAKALKRKREQASGLGEPEVDDDDSRDADEESCYASLRKKVYRRADDALSDPLALGDRVAQLRMLLAAGASVRSLAQRYGIPEAQVRVEAAKG